MTDITPEHEALMRNYCERLIGITPISSVVYQQYFGAVRPELVLMLLDMGNQMTDAVERIDQMVKAAGFDNLEQALKGIERIGKALHNAD